MVERGERREERGERREERAPFIDEINVFCCIQELKRYSIEVKIDSKNEPLNTIGKK